MTLIKLGVAVGAVSALLAGGPSAEAAPIVALTVTPNASGLGPWTFDASGTADSDPGSLMFEWDFDTSAHPFDPSSGFFNPDLNSGASATTTHNYLTLGNHRTAVRATNTATGATGLGFLEVQVVFANVPPLAVPGGPYILHVGDALLLNGALSSDPNSPNDSIVSYEWDLFIDGTVEFWGPTPALPFSLLTGIGLSSTPGATAPLLLTVVDQYGLTGSAATEVQVVAPAAVPEPTSLLLLGSGMAGIAAKVRRGRKKRVE